MLKPPRLVIMINIILESWQGFDVNTKHIISHNLFNEGNPLADDEVTTLHVRTGLCRPSSDVLGVRIGDLEDICIARCPRALLSCCNDERLVMCVPPTTSPCLSCMAR